MKFVRETKPREFAIKNYLNFTISEEVFRRFQIPKEKISLGKSS